MKRRRGDAAVDEDLSKGTLGAWEGVPPLIQAEVKHLLDVRRGQRQNTNETAVYKKTYDHVSNLAFARWNNIDTVQRVRAMCQEALPDAGQPEVVQLANLCPHEAEEAKTLIPTLARYDDETLNELLRAVQDLLQLTS